MRDLGHGHVRPRADGVKMRCGGPALCSYCQREAYSQRAAAALTQARKHRRQTEKLAPDPPSTQHSGENTPFPADATDTQPPWTDI